MRFSERDRETLYQVMRSRRDIRQFSSAPIPSVVLHRILAAAHLAPSVGFMQPWNFILVTSRSLRERIKASFEETNGEELRHLTERGRQEIYRTLKLEGILEAPLNLAVTCDRRRDAPFVLGRAPMAETDLYSTCLAVENLWLAARVEGIGVGWVSILDRSLVERLLELPPGVQLVSYLCVGYPVEFRAQPMLEEVGWKDRMLLSDLVYQDCWGKPAALFDHESSQ